MRVIKTDYSADRNVLMRKGEEEGDRVSSMERWRLTVIWKEAERERVVVRDGGGTEKDIEKTSCVILSHPPYLLQYCFRNRKKMYGG